MKLWSMHHTSYHLMVCKEAQGCGLCSVVNRHEQALRTPMPKSYRMYDNIHIAFTLSRSYLNLKPVPLRRNDVQSLCGNTVFIWIDFRVQPLSCTCRKKFDMCHRLLKLAILEISDFSSTVEGWSKRISIKFPQEVKSNNAPVFRLYKGLFKFFYSSTDNRDK